jgi:hypothetical protein
MIALKIYGDAFNIYLSRKAKIYLKKHNLHKKIMFICVREKERDFLRS